MTALVMSPGRYGLTIGSPWFSLPGDSLKERVAKAYAWAKANGATIERHELVPPSSVFLVLVLPRQARWDFDFGEPKRLKATEKTSRDASGAQARDDAIYQTAKAARDAVSFSLGGVGIAVALILLAASMARK